MRKVGPINPAEVKSFQRRFPGMTIDGKAGHQFMGEVLRIESEWHICKARKRAPQVNARALMAVAGTIGFLIGYALSAMF